VTVPRSSLRTERLVLEPIGPEWADAIWEASRPSLPSLRPWLAWAGQATPHTTRAFAEHARSEWHAGRQYAFAVLEGNEVVGGVGLYTPVGARSIGEIGYWVRVDRAGRGVTTEAAGAAVGFGFHTLGLHRIELRAGVENRPSQRVAEKLGFAREGLCRQGCPGTEGPYDCYLYGLLRREWSVG
jgi:ribosomal-protein-serine acetyltransferase